MTSKVARVGVDSPDSVFVLALDGDQVVGASTGMPMAEETKEVKTPFLAHGWDAGQIFYFGESVLLPAYRGRGVGVRFFEDGRITTRFEKLADEIAERYAESFRELAK